jgi:hypothetical protein
LLIAGVIVPQSTTHFLLNTSDRASVGAQIRHVLEFAQEQGAPFVIGATSINVVPFITEVSDQTCAQVIVDQSRFAPDLVSWFDYTTPVPTLHFGSGNARGSVSLAYGTPGTIISDNGIQIVARPDLQITDVCLRYEKTDDLDGKEYLSLAKDSYPPGSDGDGLNALNATIVLAGSKISTLKATVVTEELDVDDIEFWKRVIPKLQDKRIIALEKTGVERTIQGSRDVNNPNGVASSGYTRWLVEGQMQDWMKDVSDTPLDWEQEELTATFSYKVVKSDDVNQMSVILEDVVDAKATVQLVSTTAPIGDSTYWTLKSVEEGESVPYGLAEYLYNALSGIDYEGTISTTENECSGYIGPGHGINVTGTIDPAHASMNARVQQVTEHIDAGVTSFAFGPTPTQSLGAVLEMLRASRTRKRWTLEETQETGETASGGAKGELELGQATANNNTTPGEQQNKMFCCLDDLHRVEMDATQRHVKIKTERDGVPEWRSYAVEAESAVKCIGKNESKPGEVSAKLISNLTQSQMIVVGTGGQINCDTSLCNGKVLYPREEVWCNPTTGAKRKIMVLCSAPYD